MDSKIFVIGYNKTATSTFHHLFIKNNLKSQHAKSDKWNTQKYDCFSDIISNSTIWKTLDKKYPNSIFILNTRSLDKWLISRFKHGLRNKTKPNWAYPYTEEKCEKWIKDRDHYYLDILDYFSDCPEKLIIVNIERDGWQEYISTLLNFKTKSVSSKNVNKTKKSNYSHLNIIKLVNNTLKQMNYDKNLLLIKDSDILNKYLDSYKFL